MNKFKSYSGFLPWIMSLLLIALAAGCGGGSDPILGAGGAAAGGSSTIPGAPAGAITPGAVTPSAACSAVPGPLVPTVTSSDPTNGNQFATTSTTGVAGGGKLITATFSLPMNAATINATTFTLAPVGGAALVPASVSYDAVTRVATLTTSSALAPDTSFTAIITTGATSAAGTPLGCTYAWNFKTIIPPAAGASAINLGAASTFGIASRAGLTSTGVTVINGNVALFPLGTCTDATGAPANCQVESKPPSALGLTVNGLIRHPTDSDAGATATAVSNALVAAWNEGFNKVTNQPAIAADQLGGKTFVPGVYASANLGLAAGLVATMDAQNDPDAVFIFKVGGVAPAGDFTDSGTALLPTRIDLIRGAQAKNVWFVVGRDVVIGSGTTWNGNILAGRTFTINSNSRVLGRALAGASGAGAVTLTGAAAPTVTSITVP